MSENFPICSPVQESKLPDDSPPQRSLPSLATQKERIFGTEHDPNAPNINAHEEELRGDIAENMTSPGLSEEERPPTSVPEAVENADTSDASFAQLSINNNPSVDVTEYGVDNLSSANDPNFESPIHDQDTNPHDEEVINMHRMDRRSREGNNSHMSSSVSSSFVLFSLLCIGCEQLRKACFSAQSLLLWDTVEEGCHDNSQKCHVKLWSKFMETLKSKCKDASQHLKNKNLTELFKRLLLVEKKGQLEEIELTNVVDAIRYFGPLVNTKGESPFLEHVNEIITNSSMRNAEGERISWFAGFMSREEAVNKLQGQANLTFLIRMSKSESDSGSFVVSVKKDYVHHFLVQDNPAEASSSDPFSCNLKFDGKIFRYITDVALYLKENPIIDPDGEVGNNSIWCRYSCPGLPLNSAIVSYKKV